MRHELSVEEIRAYSGLEALRPQWTDLFERSASVTPFQSPEWLIPWWRHLGSGEPYVLALRRCGRLSGLAPFFVTDIEGVRTLLFIGTGITDYLDIVAEKETEEACAGAVADKLFSYKGWEACDLQEIRPSSALFKAVYGLHEACVAPMAPTMRLKLEGFEAFLSGLSKKFRRQVLGDLRALSRHGVAFESARGEGDVRGFMESLFAVHGRRWEDKGMPGMLSNERIRSFHLDAAPELFRAGRLRLRRFTSGVETLAALYTLAGGGSAYAYLSGFAPGPLERFSPGSAILVYDIMESISEGILEYDLLRGDEEYKYRWGARRFENYRVVITRSPGGLL